MQAKRDFKAARVVMAWLTRPPPLLLPERVGGSVFPRRPLGWRNDELVFSADADASVATDENRLLHAHYIMPRIPVKVSNCSLYSIGMRTMLWYIPGLTKKPDIYYRSNWCILKSMCYMKHSYLSRLSLIISQETTKLVAWSVICMLYCNRKCEISNRI